MMSPPPPGNSNGIVGMNSEEVASLNVRLKTQFAAEFIQMMTEVRWICIMTWD